MIKLLHAITRSGGKGGSRSWSLCMIATAVLLAWGTWQGLDPEWTAGLLAGVWGVTIAGQKVEDAALASGWKKNIGKKKK